MAHSATIWNRFPRVLLVLATFLALGFSPQAHAQTTTFTAVLSGDAEVPAVETDATGSVTATIDGSTVTVTGSFSGLSSDVATDINGGAHVHMGYAGENGPVSFPLAITFGDDMTSGTFEAANNTFTLDGDPLPDFEGQQMYVNIHSQTYAGGELRGQFLPEGTTMYEAALSGSNEVPAVVTTANGRVVASLSGSTLTVTGAFSGLSGDATAAHLHLGLAGQNGGVAVPLTLTLGDDLTSGTFEAANNTVELTAEQTTALEARQIYVNVHSDAYPGGELRGQVVPLASATWRAVLSGGNEVRANTSNAVGAVIGELDGSTLTVTGAFSGLSGDVTGAHLHLGFAGQNGGVAIPLNSTAGDDLTSGTFAAADNTFELTAEQIAALESRNIYVNVHSETYSGGEIRGQMVPAYALGMKAILSGSNAVPTTTSPALGAVVAELNGSILTVSGAFDGLESDLAIDIAGGAHLHLGMAGASGPVAFPLTISADQDLRGGVFLVVDNAFELTAEQTAALTARGLYANIHSEVYPAGEIRGQLINTASTAFTALLGGGNEVPANGSQGSGAVLAELAGSALVVSGSFEGLASDFNADIGGGAHLHTALAGANGGVAVALDASVDDGNRSGMFEPMNNRFELDAEGVATLQARGHYANIHTVDLPSGELRGQLIPSASVQLRAILSGRAEVPGNLSDALGAAIIELSGDNLRVTGAFSDLAGDLATDIAGGAHLHLGSINANGNVIVALTVDADENLRGGAFRAADNSYVITAAQRANVRNGLFYVNVHSTAYAGGEIRGQVLPFTTRVLEASLLGSNEVTAVDTDAMGTALVILLGDKIAVSGTFSGLSSAVATDIAGGAHLHIATPDANGGVAFPLTPTLDADLLGGAFVTTDNEFTLSEGQVDTLLGGGFYVNVHSLTHPGGELRGQLLPSTNVPPAAPTITAPAANAEIDIAGDGEADFTVTWDGMDANGNATYYTWQLATTPTFDTILLEAETGTDAMFTTTVGDVAALLTSAGVDVGGSIMLYHRANATDGSRESMGAPEAVTLNRGAVTAVEDEAQLPERFELDGNYPNPFNPTTTIRFALPERAEVTVAVFNALGQRVRELSGGTLTAGRHELTFEAGGLPSGLYVYRVTAQTAGDATTRTGRMVLLK